MLFLVLSHTLTIGEDGLCIQASLARHTYMLWLMSLLCCYLTPSLFLCDPYLQEEQEELAAVESEARQQLRSAQQALAEAQEALAVTTDKVGTSVLCFNSWWSCFDSWCACSMQVW